MADGPSVSSESVRPLETEVKHERPFYPNISENRLYFHGTRTKENLDKILSDGLKPPSEAVSTNTLARTVSFSDDPRYSGGKGFILGIKPEEGELAGSKGIFARSESINSGLDKLPPERNIFIYRVRLRSLVIYLIVRDKL